MAYSIFRSDNMFGTKNPTGLVNIRYSPSETDTAIENGNVVLLGSLDTSERDVFVAGTPAANSDLDLIAIVAEPEVVADERLHDLSDFINAAGAICRAYKIHHGDMFGITSDGLTNSTSGTIAVGDLAELQAATTLSIVASGTGFTEGSTAVGRIIAIEDPYYVIQVY